MDNIVTWFRHPISNGPTEGFNSRIQAIKAAARGFRNFENYRIRILFFCGRLDSGTRNLNDLATKLAEEPKRPTRIYVLSIWPSLVSGRLKRGVNGLP